jgi:arylsulfatase A-like enzyme/Tfp pilus assembly protein PilF
MVKEKRTKRLIKYLLSAVAVILILLIPIAGRLFPRTKWRLQQKSRTGFIQGSTATITFPVKDIRNVVLISIDTCRADHLSCYGYSRKTSPNIDAVAAEGIRFNHCISAVPITLPSHSSMLTGTIPPYHNVRDNENYYLDQANVTLAEVLRDNGFSTGAVIGAFVLDSQFGIDQGFDSYNDSLEDKNKPDGDCAERDAAEVTRLANLRLEKYADERFFLFLHYYDPHSPYLKHKRFTLPFLKNIYDGEIVYTDHHIGRVIRKLKELNLYDSTLLIITADHGEGLNEHNENTHGYLIYHSTVHVPLIFKLPGGPKSVVSDTVGLVDIVPTVCSLLGISVPSVVQGKNLSEYFLKGGAGEGENKRFLYCESLMPTKFDTGPLLGLVSGRWKYIHSSEPELYDLYQDPHETRNLLNLQSQQVLTMREQLRSIVQDTSFDNITRNEIVMDDETRRKLESLGYISSLPVDENIPFEQTSSNPKKFVEVYNSIERMLLYIAQRKYDEAKKVCNEMLKKWPDMKQPYLHLGEIAISEQDKQAIVANFSAYLADEGSASKSSDTLHIRPGYAIAHLNLGVISAREGKLTQAMQHYKKALSYNPYSVKANYNLGGIYFRQNKLAVAVTYYSKALDLDPEMSQANYMMGKIRFTQGSFDKAIMYFNKVLEIMPDSQDARSALRAAKHELENTISRQLKSVQENPNQPKLHNSLGTIFHNQGHFEKAVYHWDKALQLKPDWTEIQNSLSWVKATRHKEKVSDPNEAVRLARRACELTKYKRADFLHTLSVAYAAAGRFGEAIDTAEKAMELIQSPEQAKLAEEIRKHLSFYKAGEPYVEP